MKQLIFNPKRISLMLALLCSFLVLDVQAKDKKDFVKVINETFEISSDGKVDLNNRYGKVNVKTWDKNQVEIDVTITVDAKNEETAQEVFDRIKIDIQNSSNSVSVLTEIESSSNGSWWSGWSIFGGSSGSSGDYQIDYNIFMPKSNDLALANKYGDSYVAELNGDATINVKYGNLKMDGVKEDLDLILGYGNATIAYAGDTEIDIKYSNLTLKACEDTEIISKYSKLYISETKDLRCETKYDTYDIGKVSELRNEGKYDHFEIEEIREIITSTKYTDFKIEELLHSANMDMSYGGARFDEVNVNFSEINVNGNYTDFKINLEDNASYNVDVQTNYSGVKYPLGMNVVYETEEGSSHNVEGNVGGKSGGLIKARLNYGGIAINN